MSDEKEVPVDHLAEEAESPEEATKRKFREALDRKNGQTATAAAAHNDGKVRGAHSAAGGKRTFRRRAGG
ncbi:DUF5302 domain-containing protein [Nocardia sp. NPDC051030]|uniref:DUF5302 domain-containing protein n=1 Tax=Nocardia sp. NPDC051030 TaxID=3155162 RepID=UPI0034381D1D